MLNHAATPTLKHPLKRHGATGMQMTSSASPTGAHVKLTGRLEFTDHERLREIISLIGAEGAALFTLDLRKLEFIDSAGLGMLLILHEEAGARGVRMKTLIGSGAVRQTVTLARIDDVIDIEYDPA
jgi:HptB-dependent secretion and biofilm anti anti-sigma factor